MVLQASPKEAVVWGFVAAGTVVTTVMDGVHKMTATADASGTWKQTLPATAASLIPHRPNPNPNPYPNPSPSPSPTHQAALALLALEEVVVDVLGDLAW